MGVQRKLPELSLGATACLVALMLGACITFGLVTRKSFTDFNCDQAALEALPCAVTSQSAEMLSNTDNFEALDSAEVVVVAVCRGRGTYVYQSFLRELEVAEVLRGDGIEPGNIIDTYDNLAIEEPHNYSGKGQFSSERRVRPAGLGPNTRGAAPLRDGQTYLVFLNRKRDLPEGSEPRYVQVHSAYAHIALDAWEHPELVRIGRALSGEDAESIPYGETYGFNAFVNDDDARNAYLDGCRKAMMSAGLHNADIDFALR